VKKLKLLSAVFLGLMLAASTAQAELRHIEMTVFGMD
jgi:hypothetical protein